MSRPTAFVYHEVYDGRGFSRLRDSWRRYPLARRLLQELGFFESALRWYRQEPATEEDVATVHEPSYLAKVREMDAAGTGCLDYGDTPAYRGVLNRALTAVGGTLLGARLVASGQVEHAFNPGGGLHHARHDSAGGFCVFNDIVIAVRAMQREFAVERIAILDFDGHHGDGTQGLLYEEPVLTISLHRYDGRFYPRSGTEAERGEGRGRGYNLNLPLPRRTDGETYLRAVRHGALRRLRAYRPQILIVQIGADAHFGDPLVRLGLTVATFAELGRLVHEMAHEFCAGRLLLVAGGGYKPEAVAWCWAAFLASLTGMPNDVARARLAEASHEVPPTVDQSVAAEVEALLDRLSRGGAFDEPRRPG